MPGRRPAPLAAGSPQCARSVPARLAQAAPRRSERAPSASEDVPGVRDAYRANLAAARTTQIAARSARACRTPDPHCLRRPATYDEEDLRFSGFSGGQLVHQSLVECGVRTVRGRVALQRPCRHVQSAFFARVARPRARLERRCGAAYARALGVRAFRERRPPTPPLLTTRPQVFGYSGGANLPILDQFHNSPMKFIMNRSEQCCGHAAEGYARSTGRVGVILTTSGPGLTNIITPLQDAKGDSTPIVALSGQVPIFNNDIRADTARRAGQTPSLGWTPRTVRTQWG